MTLFLKRCRFFAVALLLLWLGTESFYRLVPGNYLVKKNIIERNVNTCEVLILGNSHTLFGLDPKYFDRPAVNAANVSQSLLYDQLILNKYINSLKNLKVIILPVEYSSLSDDNSNSEAQWRRYFYEEQMGLDTGLSPFDIKKYSLALAPRFSLTVASMLEYTKKGTLITCDSTGWAPLNGISKYNTPRMGAIIAAKHDDGKIDFKQNIKRIKSIRALCNRRGIKLFLVNMPVTSHYANNVNKNKRRLIIKTCKYLTALPESYYLDLFQDTRFNNHDFHDTDHLNTIGAKKCSLILNDFLHTIEI